LGAEYVLNLLPRGTHDYARFITPAELASFCRRAELKTERLIGMSYNPFTKVYSLVADTSVNYILSAQAN
jgi:2-polyprenyl-6-hydroxyphenyl methylase/3-demethylubiquinone-9 3-methyltransferase